jgi:hypothetical protein
MSQPLPPETAPPAPAAPARSEGLLPAAAPDASLEVAEEVHLDAQSDATRGIGAMPDQATPAGKPADAAAESLRPPAAKPP